MKHMSFKNKKEEKEFKEQIEEAIEVLKQQDIHFFRSEHIIPILEKMNEEQIVIFEHLTGIRRQTLH